MLNSIFSETATVADMAVMLVSAMVIGILVSMIFGYKNAQSQGFSLTLAMLPLVSALIIFMVNDHLGVSVAVAGAFTLVRFRSIAGTGRELIAIFTAMMLGLVLGMGYIGLAAIALVAIAVMVIGLTIMNFGESQTKLVKIRIPEDLEYSGIFDDIFKKYTTSFKLVGVRTKNMGTLFELSYNVTFKDEILPKAFIDELRVRNGNLQVAITDFAQSETI